MAPLLALRTRAASRTALHVATRAGLAVRTARGLATMAELPGALKRTPREIALRACSTQLLLTRWALEASALSAKEPAAAGFGALTEALAKTSITEHMTARERSLHKLDFGKWDVAEDIVGVQSRWESFGMLAWALRIVRDVPEYPNTFPHEQLYQATAVIPAFPNTIDMFVEYFTSGEGSKDGHLVTSAEFEDAVNRAEAWYWRSRAQMVLELKQGLQGDSPEIREARRKVPSGLRGVMDNIEKAISQASQRALADGLISESVDDDFAVAKGVAYRSLDDHGLRDMERMTESRLAALGWLAGTEQWEFERGEVKFINPLGSLWSAE